MQTWKPATLHIPPNTAAVPNSDSGTNRPLRNQCSQRVWRKNCCNMEQILLWASKKERKSRPSSTKAFLTRVWHSSFRFTEWLILLPTSIISSFSVVFCLRLSGTPWRGSLRYAGPRFSVSTSAPLWEIHTSLHSLHPWLPAPSLGTIPSSPFPLLLVHFRPVVPSFSTPLPTGRRINPSNSEPPQGAVHCLKKHVLCPRSEHWQIRCVVRACFLHVSSHGRRGKGALWGPLAKGTHPIHEDSTLLTESPPNTTTLEVRIWQVNFRGIQTISLQQPTFLWKKIDSWWSQMIF